MTDLSMDMKRAFDEGRFLDIVEAADRCTSPEDRLLLGMSLFKVGREFDALEVLTYVAEEAEQLSKALFYLALIHRKRGDEGSAMDCLQKYLAFYPDDDEAYELLESPETPEQTFLKEPSLELAKIYAQQGHYEQALDIYAQVEQSKGLDDDSLREAHQVQDMHVMKTLQGWLERVKR